MDKGQHLRLFIVSGTDNQVIALSTDMTLNLSAQTESSNTKDTTDDASGVIWDEFEITGRSGDIQFTALVAAGTDSAAKVLDDIITGVSDTAVNWKIAMASGTNNRTIGTIICQGSGKISNMQATGQVGQNASYSGTINIVGAVTVPS